MSSMVLTQLGIERLRPPTKGRVIHWDARVRGFGLRITDKDARSWIAMYRVAGKPVMQTLGRLSEIPKVDDARRLARTAIATAHTGVNPVTIRRAEEAIAEAQKLTFAEVADRYVHEHVDRKLRPSSRAEIRRIIEHDLKPQWGARPICEITRRDVNDLLDAKADQRKRPRNGRQDGAGIMANRILALLRALFGWAVSKDLVDVNPTIGARRRAKEISRDRVLNDDEIVAFWTACEALQYPFGPLFQVLLVTAQRRDEVGEMRWSELDVEKREWTLPRERAKNDNGIVVHLSPVAAEIIAQLPQINGSDFVFTTNGRTPVSGFSKAKGRLDQLMGGPPHWTLHDLRRTGASGMARLGIAPHVADKGINHVAGGRRGIAAVYDRYDYLPERKAALEAWGRYIESLVRPAPSSNIVELAVAH
jgi:integrase